MGATVFTLMMTWKYGREHLLDRVRGSSPPLEQFMGSLGLSQCQRVHGTAVFLTSTPDATPHALLHSLKHYKVLHEQNVFLTVEFADVPWVGPEDRVECTTHQRRQLEGARALRIHGQARGRGGAASNARPLGLKIEPMEVSYFLSREQIVPGVDSRRRLRDRLFVAMTKFSGSATDFFNIPTNRVVELGTRVET